MTVMLPFASVICFVRNVTGSYCILRVPALWLTPDAFVAVSDTDTACRYGCPGCVESQYVVLIVLPEASVTVAVESSGTSGAVIPYWTVTLPASVPCQLATARPQSSYW